MTGSYTVNAELFPTETRHLNAVFCSLTWAISVCVLPLVSWLVRDMSWRSMGAIYCCWNVTIILQLW